MRQVVLDTETTGLEIEEGHRVIEIGCIEIVDRRLTGNDFQQYLCPDRDIDTGAQNVHGIDTAFLADKPRFAEIVDDVLDYVSGAELVIHNAPFDVGFLDFELKRLKGSKRRLADVCLIRDTLQMARERHPGQRNSLDALCKRYEIDNSRRELHGALLDAQLLAEVYLAMTGGQATLSLSSGAVADSDGSLPAIDRDSLHLIVRVANTGELEAHEAFLSMLDESSGGSCCWRGLQ